MSISFHREITLWQFHYKIKETKFLFLCMTGGDVAGIKFCLKKMSFRLRRKQAQSSPRDSLWCPAWQGGWRNTTLCFCLLATEANLEGLGLFVSSKAWPHSPHSHGKTLPVSARSSGCSTEPLDAWSSRVLHFRNNLSTGETLRQLI